MSKEPKLYTEFGNLFSRILKEYLPPTSKKNPNAIAIYLMGQMKKRGEWVVQGYRSNVDNWLKGNIEGKKSLSPEAFLLILKMLQADDAHYILTIDDVESLIEKGRQDYKALLQDEFVKSLHVRSSPLMPKTPYTVEREKIVEHIVEALNVKEKNIVLLYGPSGRGKRTLMILTHRRINSYFSSILIQGQTVESLKNWIKLAINTPQVKEKRPNSFIMEEFRAKYNGKSVVFILPDCEDPEVLELLQTYLPSGCKLLVSTHHTIVAETLPYQSIIRIPQFTENETLEYMQACVPGQAWTNEEFQQLYQLTTGTPLTLYLAYRHILEQGMAIVLDKLSIAPALDQTEELTGLHRAILLGYESLSAKQKEAFGKAGLLDKYQSYDLLTFQALWQNSSGELLGPGETREYLLRLCDQAGLIQLIANQEWVIHPVIKKFAEQVASSINEKELEFARGWLSTALRTSQARSENDAVQSVNSTWHEASESEKANLMRSPLPHKLPLVVRAFRSLINAKSADLYNLLNSNHAAFSAQEMRYIKFAEMDNANSWKPYTILVSLILGLYVYLAFTKILTVFALAIVLTLILIYHHFKEGKHARNRDMLIYKIWRGRVSAK